MTNQGTRIPSRCSSGSPVAFKWFDGIRRSEPDHVQLAVEACLRAVDSDTRVWNPFAKAMVKSEFKKRIERAALGQLVPVEEVKPVGQQPSPPPLYEIRWQDIAVTDRAPGAAPQDAVFSKVIVRMYHSEPATLPDHFIGHHVHEKIISPAGDTHLLQDTEINVAAGYFNLGEASNWAAL
ncbi:hypothetical protein ACFQ36_02820 [Arthrobacter sp. GCM10027362]|uniref:hypothetical protein n=1 Tax=Arthrobacter sp. GCM10027362 TaxID=3273379 RepID=UPI003645595A